MFLSFPSWVNTVALPVPVLKYFPHTFSKSSSVLDLASISLIFLKQIFMLINRNLVSLFLHLNILFFFLMAFPKESQFAQEVVLSPVYVLSFVGYQKTVVTITHS